jgi:hypothetical protein
MTVLIRNLLILFAIVALSACGGGGGGGSNGGGTSSSSSSSVAPPLDSDGDGMADSTDTDDDNDGVEDGLDAFPLDAAESTDTDGDGVGDNTDADDDGDGVDDTEDRFPLDDTESVDTDEDGVGDSADNDDDNDGVDDSNDAFPFDAAESADTDSDGAGDNADAYPSQAACWDLVEGDGTECYDTWLADQDADQILTTGSGLYFFFDSGWGQVVIYSQVYDTYAGTVNLNSEDSATSITYSESHNRLYVGYASGNITYFDISSLSDETLLATATYGIGRVDAAGEYLYVQTAEGGYTNSYSYDESGAQIYNDYGYTYTDTTWVEDDSRLYYVSARSYDALGYMEIDQTTGYMWERNFYVDYESVAGSIRPSPTGDRILYGSGHIVDTTSMKFAGNLGYPFEDAFWLSDDEFVALVNSGDDTYLFRYDATLNVIEYQQFSGSLLGAFKQGNNNYLVLTDGVSISFQLYAPNDDIDGDGVSYADDAFPNDPAASVDSDFDGYPDAWNDGHSAETSTDGLQLDAYPTDSACYLAEQGDGTTCDIAAAVPSFTPDQVIIESGVVYLLNTSDSRVYRWSLEAEAYLNPLVLSRGTYSESMSLSIEQGRLYVGYSSGAIVYFDLDDNTGEQFFVNLPGGLDGLIAAGNYLVGMTDGDYYSYAYVYAEDGSIASGPRSFEEIEGARWNSVAGKVFAVTTNSYYPEVYSFQVDQENGELSNTYSGYDYEYPAVTPVRVSVNGDFLVHGGGDIYSVEPLQRLASLGHSLDDAVWLDSDELAIFVQGTTSFEMTRYRSDTTVLEQINFSGSLQAVASNGADLLMVILEDGSLRFDTYIISADTDGDGVGNSEDDFPNDVAASVDSDSDGLPDAWNEGYTESDSQAGLILDAFPNDFNCQSEADGVEGECNYAAIVPDDFSPTLVTSDNDGVFYLLDGDNQLLHRWSSEQEQYLDSIPVAFHALTEDASVTDMAYVSGHDQVYLGYDSGAVVALSTELNESFLPFAQLDYLVTSLADAGNYLIASARYYGSQNIVLDSVGNSSNYQFNWSVSDDSVWSEADSILYYLYGNYYLIAQELDANGAPVHSNRSAYLDQNAYSLFVTGDGQSVGLGSGDVYAASGFEMLENELVPFDFASTSDDFVLLIDNSEDSAQLHLYSNDSLHHVATLEHSAPVIYTSMANDQFHYVSEGSSGLEFYSLMLGDADGDGIPTWWEDYFALDDSDANDADLDADEDSLSNLNEYINRTYPDDTDSDDDGLSDYHEVDIHSTNPRVADSDGDTLDDGWEVTYGLDPLDSADASQDSDGDSFSNLEEFQEGFDPTDGESQPEVVADQVFSFDGAVIPDGLSISDRTPAWEIITTDSSDDDPYSLSFASSGRNGFVLDGFFVGNDLVFDVKGSCSRLYVYVDGVDVQSLSLSGQNTDWQTISMAIPRGRHEVEVSSSYCAYSVDNIRLSESLSLADIGVHFATADNRNLQLFDYDGQAMRAVTIQSVESFDARGLVVMESGDLAIINRYSSYDNDLVIYHSRTHLYSSYSLGNYIVDQVGAVATAGDYVFLLSSLLGDDTQGVVRLNVLSGDIDLVAEGSYVDLSVASGMLYAKSSGTDIEVYDVETLDLDSTISAASSGYFAIAEDGSRYFGTSSGSLNKYDSEGAYVGTLSLGASTIRDIDVSVRGDIVVMYSQSSYPYSGTYAAVISPALDVLRSVTISTYSYYDGYIALVSEVDADEDNMPSWWELEYDLDDSNADDAVLDGDEDGLTNLEEFSARTLPGIADTDEDSLSDGDEVLIHGTSPLSSDTDEDGLTDADELNVHATEPTDWDTDDDGFSDGAEINLYSTDPNDETSLPEAITSYSEDFESGAFASGWTHTVESGANWVVANDESYAGTYSLRSGGIGGGQLSAIQLQGLFAAGNFSFYAFTETESCCDYLQVYLDDQLMLSVTSPSEWQEFSVPIDSGEHLVELRYRKDGSVSTGRDAVWIDNLSFSSP